MRSTSILKSRSILFAALMTSTALVSIVPFTAHAADKIVDGGDVETITTTENFDNVTVGDVGEGTLTIESPGAVTNTGLGIIGNGPDSTGTVTVTGAGATWTNNDGLLVGREGTGTLTISNGGAVSNSQGVIGVIGGVGTVMVTGTGSSWTSSDLIVGNIGTGALTIESGGTVNSSAGGIGASSLSSSGVVTVTGGGSSWINSGSLSVGQLGEGGMTIADGGLVENTIGIIGLSEDSTGTVIVTGSNSTWTNSGNLLIGNEGTGTLTISNGSVVHVESGAGTVDIAADATATGTLNIGAAAGDAAVAAGTLNATTLAFGAGEGILNFNHTEAGYDFGAAITGAGTINQIAGVTNLTGDSSGFTGNTNVTGGELVVRNALRSPVVTLNGGTLRIEGGTLSGTTAFIARDFGFSAAALVTGAGSTWTNSSGLAVGNEGAGTLTIADGGTVSNTTGVIANEADSTGTVMVTGTGSTWTNSANLTVGSLGDGTLTIADGGLVSNAAGFIAGIGGSTGTVIVTGTNSTWTSSGNLNVGNEGAGTLTIADGGRVASGGIVTIGTLFLGLPSAGTLNIGAAAGDAAAAAGTLNATGGVTFGAGAGTLNFNHTDTNYTFGAAMTSGSGTATLNQIAGVTNLTGDSSGFGGNTNVTGGLLSVNGALGGAVSVTGGTLGGSGTLAGNVSVTNGAIAAGNSPGTLTIGGDLLLASASALNFELGSPSGTAGVDSDLIVVGGDLTLDGTLNVSDAGGFGAGVYRLVDYGGSLTDNGLDIGTRPADFLASDLAVQTAVANQVNLIVGAPSGLSFWDGANLTANGAVDGGSGTWNATNTNWTTTAGTTNGVFNIGVLQVFQGAGGTVTVDNSGGAIATSAMQFAADGYTVAGDDLTLSGAATIRVGDGTATGAGYTTTIASSLIGTGSLEKTDLGTLILTGANSYSGGTTISGGRLVGNANSLQGDIVNNAAVTFDQTSTGTYAGVISGSGALTKAGAGELILTADSSAYAGTTDIAAGLLTVNGSLGGVINFSGGTLGGSGTLGDVTIASGGTLAPGNSIGTLNVTDITINAGSTYMVELDDGGFVAGTNNDLTNATGTATINGGTVHVTPENGTDDGTSYTPGTYTILTAAGGVTGTFDAISDDYAFLNFALGYDPNNVLLTSSLAGGSFCLTGMSANQCGVGESAFSLGAGNAVFDAVLTLSDAEAPGALDQLSGEIHASAKTALLEGSRLAREAALDRLRVALGGTAAGVGQVTQDAAEGTSIWAQGFGAWSRQNGDGNASPLDHTIGGLFMGGDAEITDNVTLGLMGGYSRSLLALDALASSATVDSYTLGAYAGGAWDAVSLKGGVAHSWHSLDASRSVAFTGFSDSLDASYNARTFQAYTEAAYSFDYGNVRFEPFANLAYVNLSTDGFTESGGAAALSAAANVVDATFTTLGLRAETPVDLGEMQATLSGGLAWRHAFGDTPTATQSLAGGNAFTVAGVSPARDTLVLDAGLTLNLTDSATLGLSYTGQMGSGISDHGARASLNVRF